MSSCSSNLISQRSKRMAFFCWSDNVPVQVFCFCYFQVFCFCYFSEAKMSPSWLNSVLSSFTFDSASMLQLVCWIWPPVTPLFGLSLPLEMACLAFPATIKDRLVLLSHSDQSTQPLCPNVPLDFFFPPNPFLLKKTPHSFYKNSRSQPIHTSLKTLKN